MGWSIRSQVDKVLIELMDSDGFHIRSIAFIMSVQVRKSWIAFKAGLTCAATERNTIALRLHQSPRSGGLLLQITVYATLTTFVIRRPGSA